MEHYITELNNRNHYVEEVSLPGMDFVTLCCGILTIETLDCFFRSFCFFGQNGTFSTTEQNPYRGEILFL